MSTNDFQIPSGKVEQDGQLIPLLWPIDKFYGHIWVSGGTGLGKTMFAIGLLAGLIRTQSVGVLVCDAKSDLAPTLLQDVLPGMYHRFRDPEPRNVLVVDPFGPYPNRLNMLWPVPGMEPAIQANLVTEVVCTLCDGLGPRMKAILTQLALAELSLATVGEKPSLRSMLRMLVDATYRTARGSRTPDAALRQYVLDLDRENSASLDALASRLRWLNLVPAVSAALNAEGCITGEELIESPITVCSLGNPPHGLESLGHLLMAWILLLVQHAVFSRTVGPTTRQVVLCLDEWQRAAEVAPEGLERLLSLARFKRVSCILINQTLHQLRHSPVLLESLKTNISLSFSFRPDLSDLDFCLPLLHTGGVRPDPLRPDRLLSSAAETALIARELAALPPRWCLAVDRKEGRSHLLRTLSVDLEKARRNTASLPPDVREAFLRGRAGVPRDVLIAEAQEEACHEAREAPSVTPIRPTSRRRETKLVLPS